MLLLSALELPPSILKFISQSLTDFEFDFKTVENQNKYKNHKKSKLVII